ncbi:hypothetical protein CAS74_002518 [Pichia kudriavzevii]|uniref:Uncharacterized protein n=1 Tax=Pichia kudriavzevii TaxID=4909 RepID=A0A1Z8JQ90_PICKU|nr:uncharacterized protein C5L36_0D05360 [Pichia kudriavzevii]AWU77810.1 hypothetical protein C5L36_0D05360 [Pichia kudriavzevii]OUT22773.1 hypothetical protein CAS74_002518 [Pichia kudriavzevii]
MPHAGGRRAGDPQHQSYISEDEYLCSLKVYGYSIIVVTWLVFTVSIGTIFNLWEWCLDVGSVKEWLLKNRWISLVYREVSLQEKPVENYYIFVFFLNFVILWIWAVSSWISMKLFRHSKGGGS